MIQPDVPLAGPHLPVPYESPWGRLAGDLEAVFASLRLQLRQLWRRNREGDLPAPGFWPRDLAPIFWPGLLLAVLGLVIALAFVVVAPAPAVAPSQPQPLEADSASELRTEPPIAEPLVAAPPIAEPPPEPGPGAPAAEPERPAPLLELFAEQDRDHWIVSADAAGPSSLVQLRVGASFTALADRQQLELAQHWLDRTEELGFDQLEICDRQGRVLGRRALVGSGMILLSPQHFS